MALFADLIEVAAAPDGGYTADIESTWTVGPKVHGGALLAVCASAARAAYRDAGGDAECEPLVISAEYLGAPDPGAIALRTEVRKIGRTTSVVNVQAVQADRTYVQAVITLARRDAGDELYAESTALDDLPPTPSDDALAWDPDHPMASVFGVGRVAEVRYDAATLPVVHGRTGAALTRGWVRLREEPVTALFALLATDISLPVVANIGKIGWAPTLTLTATVRREPADGWLRFRAAAPIVGGRWFDEDHLIVDRDGHVVASSRQLAMLPATTN